MREATKHSSAEFKTPSSSLYRSFSLSPRIISSGMPPQPSTYVQQYSAYIGQSHKLVLSLSKHSLCVMILAHRYALLHSLDEVYGTILSSDLVERETQSQDVARLQAPLKHILSECQYILSDLPSSAEPVFASRTSIP